MTSELHYRCTTNIFSLPKQAMARFTDYVARGP
jgi:hypothetical protein